MICAVIIFLLFLMGIDWEKLSLVVTLSLKVKKITRKIGRMTLNEVKLSGCFLLAGFHIIDYNNSKIIIILRIGPMNKSDIYSQALSQSNLRLTPQRLAVCRILAASEEHPTAQMIYEQVRKDYPSLSLATVYNTLETLVSLGLVNALGSAGDGKVHYDGDTEPHVNLACLACNKVVDFPSQYVDELQREVAEYSGYKLMGARVLYYGYCPQCQENGKG
jgi:Fur family transcriptional regulator, peroxide stress response regulator